MNTKEQKLAWKCLPSETREAIRQTYFHYGNTPNKSVVSELEAIFGQHNILSDTEPEEMLMVKKSKAVELYRRVQSDDYIITSSGAKLQLSRGIRFALKKLFGDKCLPDTLNTPNSGELKSPSVQVEPKFKVGDIVRVKCPPCKGEIGIIDEIGSRIIEYHLQGSKALENFWFAESDLEPYPEPETKETMEEKELNRKALYNALSELESASKKVRKALISLQ